MSKQTQLIEFLKRDLAIPAEAIALGLRQSASTPNLLPIVLWQYGLVTTQQLEQIFDWLEARTS
ncbi:MAG: DUF2949 domain-containing protein [Leptolyngbyaceae cyanobacterium SL_1_1]|nr:DUF2949 domain-containing protein [Leptolyngbyaceae cyanobacterium RM1_1_2]NJO11427.1 DUF2949 domain-containing protein [Leptolyngbyaceae cyanobacterium SL_1_1]